MTTRILATLLLPALLAPLGYAEDRVRERPEWQPFFTAYEAAGTIVVADERGGISTTSVFDDSRARHRYSPASTFKIPHALFALDAGVVRDEFQVFRWDGAKRTYDPWNRD